MRNMKIQPKMTRQQAIKIWDSLTPAQKMQFNEMLQKMENKELYVSGATVDDNEHVKTITLDPVNKPGKPTKPFAKHFKQD
jgi:pentose-5-phosphate-3-epimerase